MPHFRDKACSAVCRLALGATGVVSSQRLTVLIFHRVLPVQDPLFPSELHAARFEQLMRMVAATFKVLPLDQALRRLADRSLPARSLAISFDDGYADNHDVAFPILQRLGLSATVFVSTAFLGGGRMWNDSVIESVRRTRLPALDLGEFGLSQMPVDSVEQRRAAIASLLPLVKYSSLARRQTMLERIHALCGRPELPNDFMMTPGQVVALHRGGMGIGAHTVNHPILCVLPDADARAEMAGSRDELQRLIDAPVSLFAYPNGRLGKDYDERHAALAKALGFAAAVSTTPTVAKSGADLYQVPRYTPWDVSDLRWMSRLATTHALG